MIISDFILKLIEILIWPVTLIFFLFFLKKPIIRLLNLMDSFKYKDIELNFNQKIKEVSQEIVNELPKANKAISNNKEALYNIADFSPRASILEAWLLIEKASIELIRKKHPTLSSRISKSPLLLIQTLEEDGYLDEKKAAIFHKLRSLRNSVAHSTTFNPDSSAAIEYIESSLWLLDYLNKLAAKA